MIAADAQVRDPEPSSVAKARQAFDGGGGRRALACRERVVDVMEEPVRPTMPLRPPRS